MALEKFQQDDVDQMKRVEKAIVDAVLPFNARTPAALVAISLIRCARTMLRTCTKHDQKVLLPVLIAFLQGKVSPPSDAGLILPPSMNN